MRMIKIVYGFLCFTLVISASVLFFVCVPNFHNMSIYGHKSNQILPISNNTMIYSSAGIFTMKQSTIKSDFANISSKNFSQKQLVSKNATLFLNLSIIIPGTSSDIAFFLPELLYSILNQTVKNREIIIVLTGTSTDQCTELKKNIRSEIPCYVFCFEKLRREYWARNYGVQMASSEWVAFCDSDDRLFAHHNAVLQYWINCKKKLRFILHGYTPKSHVEHRDFDVISGTELWRAAKKLQHHKIGVSILPPIMHSQGVCRREDALVVLYKTAYPDDSLWCKDMALWIGNNSEKMIVDTTPLSWYWTRAQKQKSGFVYPKTLTSNLVVKKYPVCE